MDTIFDSFDADDDMPESDYSEALAYVAPMLETYARESAASERES